MTRWLPDHEASQPEPPEELSALQGLAAAMHSRCMASDQFMTTVQQEAAHMTAKQAEQLQVCQFFVQSLHTVKRTQTMTHVVGLPYFPSKSR